MTTEERIEQAYQVGVKWLDSVGLAIDNALELLESAREIGMGEPSDVYADEWGPRGITLEWADINLSVTPVREDGSVIYYWERGLKQGWWTAREIREKMKEYYQTKGE